METKLTFKAIDSIENIYHLSKGSQLNETFFEAAKSNLVLLSPYLQLSEIETVLFANAFVMWFEESSFAKIFEHFGMTSFQVLKYRDSIEVLYQRNLLMNKEGRKKQITSYDLSQSVINTISRNEAIKFQNKKERVAEKNFVDLLEEFDGMSDQLDSNTIHLFDFCDYIEMLRTENLEMPIFREIKNYQLDLFETFFFLDAIWDTISCGDNDFNTNIQSTVSDYFKQKSQALYNIKKLVNKETKLSKLGLIEISNETFMNKPHAKLTKKVTDFLRDHQDLVIDDVSNEHSKLMAPQKIPQKTLFFNPAEEEQLTQISNILEDSQFKKMQLRLKEKAMPTGITAIFHGVPGTGKTESVYQMAKESGRSIFKVDISETKSMWFGESQKLVKKIFTQYQDLKRSTDLCPILLCNEADAIIGKRKSAGSSNTADTENAIQNIFLEEMENFDGILFATTNLVENMDAAFERRFLFKVKFDQPSTENAAKIWREKLPVLTQKESLKLAENFNFSGGEMENIARKCTMHELLQEEKLTFKLIEKLCGQEKWSSKSGNKIGF